jgi:hypothetical protein
MSANPFVEGKPLGEFSDLPVRPESFREKVLREIDRLDMRPRAEKTKQPSWIGVPDGWLHGGRQ